jgi:hypothetical protein
MAVRTSDSTQVNILSLHDTKHGRKRHDCNYCREMVVIGHVHKLFHSISIDRDRNGIQIK